MNQTSTTFCERLVADGPDAEYADALNLFGQFIGSWDFTWRDVAGPETTGTGEWHFGWVLQGRAVQDVWIAYNGDGSLYEYGTTIRCYNPLTGTWNVSWNGPVKGNLKTFVARKIGREIVLEGATRPVISSIGSSRVSRKMRSAGAAKFRRATALRGRSTKRCS